MSSRTAKVAAKSALVRKTKNKKSSKLGELENGTVVEVLDEATNKEGQRRSHIAWGDGKEGTRLRGCLDARRGPTGKIGRDADSLRLGRVFRRASRAGWVTSSLLEFVDAAPAPAPPPPTLPASPDRLAALRAKQRGEPVPSPVPSFVAPAPEAKKAPPVRRRVGSIAAIDAVEERVLGNISRRHSIRSGAHLHPREGRGRRAGALVAGPPRGAGRRRSFFRVSRDYRCAVFLRVSRDY